MENSACFIGHRNVTFTPDLCLLLFRTIIRLIQNGTVNFIFGDHSQFNDFCYNTVTALMVPYPHIRRILFVRRSLAAYQEYFKNDYEEFVLPDGIEKAGVAVYIERNRAMIDESDVCVFYYREETAQNMGKTSGTERMYRYALSHSANIINIPDSADQFPAIPVSSAPKL